MLSMKSRLLNLDDLLDRLMDVIETEGSQRVPSISCKGTPIRKQNHASPLAMHLDFYANANMNAENAPSRALESIENKYRRNRSNFVRDENYRSTYDRKHRILGHTRDFVL